MNKSEFFAKIPTIITGFRHIEEYDGGHFHIFCSGCVFRSELNELHKFCYVSHVGYSSVTGLLEISCLFD